MPPPPPSYVWNGESRSCNLAWSYRFLQKSPLRIFNARNRPLMRGPKSDLKNHHGVHRMPTRPIPTGGDNKASHQTAHHGKQLWSILIQERTKHSLPSTRRNRCSNCISRHLRQRRSILQVNKYNSVRYRQQQRKRKWKSTNSAGSSTKRVETRKRIERSSGKSTH